MDGGLIVLLLGGTAIPFVSYGIAGVWNFWKQRQRVDPKVILAERYAAGEIDDDEYARRLSVLSYGPPLVLPELVETRRELPGQSASERQ